MSKPDKHEMNDLSDAKPGDILWISNRWNRQGYLQKVERVTPTGRVITKGGEYNPNGARRGESGFSRSYARIATADDIAGINRYRLVEKLRHFPWDKLDAENLKKVGELIDGIGALS